MKIETYLYFNGQCAEAFEFYADVLGGELSLTTHDEVPDDTEVPESQRERILNASLTIGDTTLMGSDIPAGDDDFEKPHRMRANLQVDDPAEAERIFAVFSENGNIDMPLEQTFWAKRFGMVTDRFGIPWMINCY